MCTSLVYETKINFYIAGNKWQLYKKDSIIIVLMFLTRSQITWNSLKIVNLNSNEN